jgi:cysteine desulfurase/selenocysteine lyase
MPVPDLANVRADFPALHQTVHGRSLVYLDSAATALKPRTVIDAVCRMLAEECANVHRGVHALSEAATASYEAVRGRVARLLGVADPAEIVFTRGTTEAINLAAQSFGRAFLRPGDEVLVTELEHHANLVPWQLCCADRGATLRVLPIDDQGGLRLDLLPDLLGPRTRLVAMSHVSNVLGTIQPVRQIAELAHACGAAVLVDGAQAAPHLPLDLPALGCDLYALSGHKLFGPTGAGVLWGRAALLEALPPWQGGGGMVRSVTLSGARYREPPYRFEAGTPDIAAVVGLGAAVDYLRERLPAAAAHEALLLSRARAVLAEVPGLRVLGRPQVPLLSFTVDGIHPHDLGTVLDRHGVAVRTGHQCAQPLHARLGVPATTRASFALYNTLEEVDALGRALHDSLRRLRP